MVLQIIDALLYWEWIRKGRYQGCLEGKGTKERGQISIILLEHTKKTILQEQTLLSYVILSKTSFSLKYIITLYFRYRKYNLYGQSYRMQPGSVEYSYFDADFGVRFGTFICFDIMFEDPPVVLN